MPEQADPIAGLVADHREIEGVVTAARDAITAACGSPAEATLVAVALEALRDLEAFAEVDLALHIAKEERVLFPALREAAENATGDTIDDMLAQHDEVRERNQQLRAVLDAIDGHHDEVRAETESLRVDLKTDPSPAVLESLLDTVKRLDWILQGHFMDEEINLFEPAHEIFSAAVLSDLALRMSALDAEYV
ncbi:hypothetical protein AYO38_07605 [bacterium SCGC AG-212-C10]|nr:hypothetical protein AYO38_07605 [bacterium SCGC AG-212-C10]